jgi:acyl-CoA synthetase (AMP-forming)/AMP-acid ligase II
MLRCAGTVEWENRRLGTVGPALPGVKIRIIDPATMEELPSDTDGEVKHLAISRCFFPCIFVVDNTINLSLAFNNSVVSSVAWSKYF